MKEGGRKGGKEGGREGTYSWASVMSRRIFSSPSTSATEEGREGGREGGDVPLGFCHVETHVLLALHVSD